MKIKSLLVALCAVATIALSLAPIPAEAGPLRAIGRGGKKVAKAVGKAATFPVRKLRGCR